MDTLGVQLNLRGYNPWLEIRFNLLVKQHAQHTKKMLRISNINTKETTMELYDIDWNVIEKIFDDLEETFNLFNEDEEQ